MNAAFQSDVSRTLALSPKQRQSSAFATSNIRDQGECTTYYILNPPTATMSDSESSGLSSADEQQIKKLAPIFQKAKKATKLVAPPPKASPPRPKRPPSPPHEITLADNEDVAVSHS